VHRFPRHHSLRHLLDAWRARPRAATVALVVGTQGSSYRKAGALALVDADGLVAGCISGGCLEAELLADAQAALVDGRCLRRQYDTRGDDDRWFGSQSGCRGATDVLLWPASAPHPLLAALSLADQDHRSVWVDFSGVHPEVCTHGLDGCLRIAPPPRVLLLGGGPEAPPLLAIAQALGWRVDVIEHRSRYRAEGRLDAADGCIDSRPGEALARIDIGRYDAALCATHLFDEDKRCLELLAGSTVPFIGLLGPPARRDELLSELDDDTRERLGSRLQAPAGLSLGAHGPEAVAMAIAARLTQQFAHG
jgi:xanthine dehydrogenase accessory factor